MGAIEAITYLTGIAILLMLGVLATAVAKRLRASNILFLVVVGLIISNSPFGDYELFSFPSQFMVGLAVLTLAMIVFDGTSRLSLHTVDVNTNKAVEMTLIYLAVNIILVGSLARLLFFDWTLTGVMYALIFAVVMTGTDPGSIFVLLGEVKHKSLDFLRIEAIFNTPIIVVIPFFLFDLLQDVEALSVAATFTTFLGQVLLQVVVGIGAGVLLGIIVFRVMRKYYSETLSPVAIIGSAILTYVLAESLGGNGVLAVGTLGLVFGNTYVKHRGELLDFSNLLTLTLEILVFVLIGLLVSFDFPLMFFLKSLLLFALALVARYVALLITEWGQGIDLKQKLFMTLNMPKGIAVAVVTLTISVFGAGTDDLITLMILFMLYSLVLASVVDRFGKHFIGKEVVKK